MEVILVDSFISYTTKNGFSNGDCFCFCFELPYGTMADDEMKKLDIPSLQDEGFIFLWVTGRAMELGRECLKV